MNHNRFAVSPNSPSDIKRQNITQDFLLSPFFKYGMVFVFSLILAMSAVSRYNAHPDEVNHIQAVQYYLKDHWLPPAIGDPEAKYSYSDWGVSYLNYYGIEYLLAGKLAKLVLPIIGVEVIAARFFNVCLFLGLVILFLRRARHDNGWSISMAFILCSPQIWYVFSYTNNDAFPLFLSLLIVSELTYQDSPTCQFLRAHSFHEIWGGGFFLGLWLGILSIEKSYYLLFIAFVGFWFIYTSVTLKTNPLRISLNHTLLVRYLFILFVAFSVFLTRYALDVTINGEASFTSSYGINILTGNSVKDTKLSRYREEMAVYPYKPSTIKNNLLTSHYASHLRDRGLTYCEIFTKWQWHVGSFFSFVGNYGWLTIRGPDYYYQIMAYLFVGFFLFLTISIILSRNVSLMFLMTVAYLAIAMMIFVSSYHSWVNDFQAQGRYLFPTVGILSLLLYQSRCYLRTFITNLLILGMFLMSSYSFVFVGLVRINN